jgi:hypothetical protein
VTLLALATDGAHLLSASDNNILRIWNINTGETEQEIIGCAAESGDSVICIAISPNVVHIASGWTDSTVKIWNAQTGEVKQELEGHSQMVNSVAFSPDGVYLVSGSDDSTVRIWNVESGEMERELVGHSGAVRSVTFSPDCVRIASGAADGIRLWNATTGETDGVCGVDSPLIFSVAFSRDGTRIISRSMGSKTIIWNITSGEFENVREIGMGMFLYLYLFAMILSLTQVSTPRNLSQPSKTVNLVRCPQRRIFHFILTQTWWEIDSGCGLSMWLVCCPEISMVQWHALDSNQDVRLLSIWPSGSRIEMRYFRIYNRSPCFM